MVKNMAIPLTKELLDIRLNLQSYESFGRSISQHILTLTKEKVSSPPTESIEIDLKALVSTIGDTGSVRIQIGETLIQLG